MSVILSAPKFVSQLPAAQRDALAPRQSELVQAAERLRDQLKGHRDQWALAAQGLTSTSSVYEAFRKAGCEVRVVRQVKDGQPVTQAGRDSKGQPKDYPVCDIYVMLPAGEIRSLSNRKPWVAPDKRLAALRDELKAPGLAADRRAEIQAEIDAVLERNPRLR